MGFRSLLAAPAMGLLISLPALGMDITEGRDPVITATRGSERVGLLQASQGLGEIRAGRYREASRFFNAALKFEPENAHLHFLNGLTYHLLYSQGHQANRELAETAYTLALRLAPDHALSAYYLGLIHLDGRQYPRAQAALAHALLLERDDPTVLQTLAVASYYAHDIGMAQWAIERVEQTSGASADTLRTAALIYAAAGRRDDAQKRTDQLREMAGADVGTVVDKRVRHWLSYHESNRGKLLRTASRTVPLSPEAATGMPAAPTSAPAPVQAPADDPKPATPTSCATGPIARSRRRRPPTRRPTTVRQPIRGLTAMKPPNCRHCRRLATARPCRAWRCWIPPSSAPWRTSRPARASICSRDCN